MLYVLVVRSSRMKIKVIELQSITTYCARPAADHKTKGPSLLDGLRHVSLPPLSKRFSSLLTANAIVVVRLSQFLFTLSQTEAVDSYPQHELETRQNAQ